MGTLALFAAVLAGTCIGETPIPVLTVLQTLANKIFGATFGLDPIDVGIIWNYRLPRAIVAACCGAGLAVSGMVLQSLLRNALADPYLLGISAGASTCAVAVTVAGLGEEISTNVGLNYNQVVLIGTVLVAVATGVVTVVVGNLPFLGLIVPNIVSMFRGDDLRSNLPWVCLLGVAIVTVCDLLARTLIAPFELPVSVILGVVGAAVFIGLLLRRRRV